jgi:hypothetical protein
MKLRLRAVELLVFAVLVASAAATGLADWSRRSEQPPSASMRAAGSSMPFVDLAAERWRRVVVDREAGQYLGHVTTVLLEDGRTIIAVYPKGHGRGPIVMKRSADGGLTWSDRLPVPENWATSLEVPTIYRVVGPSDGRRRLILFSGLHPCRMAVSEDNGLTWTPLAPVGNWGGIVTMASVERLANGQYLAMFHDDGRFFRKGGQADGVFRLYQTRSTDGGRTWAVPAEIFRAADLHLCEPGLVRSPDGSRLAALLRENSRHCRSHVIFSDDEAGTWTAPVELPAELTGDRHTARYAPDRRLFVSFRDMADGSPTRGDWVAWVGTWDDLVNRRNGQYRIRLMDNRHDWDCAYPGVEVLRDGTIVATSYGYWDEGQPPYIVSVRLRLDDMDRRVKSGR